MDLRVRYQPVTEDISDDDEEVEKGQKTNKTDISLHNWWPWRPWALQCVSSMENEKFNNIRVKLEVQERVDRKEFESKSDKSMVNAKTALYTVIKKEPEDDYANAGDVFHGAQELCLGMKTEFKGKIEIEDTKIEDIEPPALEMENEGLDKVVLNYSPGPELLSDKVTSNLTKKLFKCKQCGHKSKYISHLKTHTMIHDGKKAFNCDQCEYTACSPSLIKRHKKKHSGGETESKKSHKGIPLNCSQCNFNSFHARNIRAHKKNHTANQTFICDQCDYLASCAGNLNRHIMKHSGERPFKCDLCNYSASNAHHVRTHKRKHSGEKPFKCDQCDYAASRTDNLKVHKRNHQSDFSAAPSKSVLKSLVMDLHSKVIPLRRVGI